jgi:hypothetical protein
MRQIVLPLIAVLALSLSGCVSVDGTVIHQTWQQPYGKVRHVVMFAYIDTTTPDQRRGVEEAMRRLPSQIPQIKAFECGIENSGRNMNKGLTNANLFTFDSREDLQIYLNHPAHKDFVAFARPYLKDLFVFDYIAEK